MADTNYTREQIADLVQRATDGLRADVENLERLVSDITGKTNRNEWDIERVNEVLGDLKRKSESVEKNVSILLRSKDEQRLIRSIVFGLVGLVLLAFVGAMFVKLGLPFR